MVGLRVDGTNPRALGRNPRALGINPRAIGTNERKLGTNPCALDVMSLQEIAELAAMLRSIDHARPSPSRSTWLHRVIESATRALGLEPSAAKARI